MPCVETLRFPPPYSPDVDPIDMAFSKIKARVKKPPLEPSLISGAPSLKALALLHLQNAKTTITSPGMSTNNKKYYSGKIPKDLLKNNF